MKDEKLDKLFKNLQCEFLKIKNLKEKRELSSKYDLFLLEAHGYEIAKYKMTNKELTNLKENLRVEYVAIAEFEKKFTFWQKYQGDLSYKDSKKYLKQYKKAKEIANNYAIQLRQENYDRGKKDAIIDYSGYGTEVTKLINMMKEEDQVKGIVEPVPITMQDKAFVAKYWFEKHLINRAKDKPPIYDYETYKSNFQKEIQFKPDIYEFIEHEKLNFENKIEKHIKIGAATNIVVMPDGNTMEFITFIKYLTNTDNDFQIDFNLLYECSKLYPQGFNDLYFLGSKLIPLYQCKRFLNAYIKNKGENDRIQSREEQPVEIETEVNSENESNDLEENKILSMDKILPIVLFPKYLKIENQELFAEKLKNEFQVEKSKKMKILIECLQNEKILFLGDRDLKGFLESMKMYFDRDLGSYQSINDFKYSEKKHGQDFAAISNRLKLLIKDEKKQENSL